MHARQLLVMGAVNLVGPGATYSWLGCQQHVYSLWSEPGQLGSVLSTLSGTFGTMHGWGAVLLTCGFIILQSAQVLMYDLPHHKLMPYKQYINMVHTLGLYVMSVSEI